MKEKWFTALRNRISAAWAVLVGRAYAGYFAPDIMDEVRLRIALCEIEEIVEGKADVDDGVPNDAMRILVLVRGVIPSQNQTGTGK